jgi:uncharacterized protein (TIGR02246 family)
MKRLVLGAAVVFLAAPALAQSVRSEIEKANAAWTAAFNRGDAAGVAALYTEDAIVLPPGLPIVRGRADIEKLWQGAFASTKNPQLKTLEVTSFGDAAREIGEVTVEKGGTPSVGKYVVIWKKVGPNWMLETDIWNRNE